jgi:hypothetical protein
MSRISDDQIDELLKQGLRGVPVPEASADFDSRVRARLRRPQSRWHWLWSALQPALAPAGLSLAVTLAALIIGGAPKPGSAPGAKPVEIANSAPSRRPDRLRAIERDLERLDRETPSLGRLGGMRAETPQMPPTPPLQPGRRGASSRGEAGTRTMG